MTVGMVIYREIELTDLMVILRKSVMPRTAIIVLAPIQLRWPIHFGIDPVQYGLIMVVNLALGLITPPFGVNVFVACTVA